MGIVQAAVEATVKVASGGLKVCKNTCGSPDGAQGGKLDFTPKHTGLGDATQLAAEAKAEVEAWRLPSAGSGPVVSGPN